MSSSSGVVPSPTRWFALSLGSGLAGCLMFPAVDLLRGHYGKLYALLPLALLLMSFAGLFMANSRLRDGIRRGLWHLADVERLRRLTESAPWTWLTVACCVAMVVTFLLPDTSRGLRTQYWPCFWAIQVLTQLRAAMQAPKPPRGDGSALVGGINWRDAAPLHSEHWGHPKKTFLST